MTTIVCTGIAGCGEKEYLKKFVNYCRRKEKKVNIINVTDVVIEFARKSDDGINKYNLLNFPRTTREAWYRSAFNSVLKERLKEDEINVINIHVTYWWKNGPEQVIRADMLNSFFHRLNPLFFFQIIDTFELIKRRVDKVAEHIGRALSREDIIRWQDVESYVVSMYAQMNGKKFYLIAREQPADTLYRLIFDGWLKVYMSYPMTFLKEKKYKKSVSNFLKRLNRIAIVFDPGTIEDYEFSKEQGIKELSGEMTVKRDYRLIDQSDVVIAYFPKVVHSSGVNAEMNYAHSTGKPVYLVWPVRRCSPFTGYIVFKMFSNVDECLKEIKKVAEQRKKKVSYSCKM